MLASKTRNVVPSYDFVSPSSPCRSCARRYALEASSLAEMREDSEPLRPVCVSSAPPTSARASLLLQHAFGSQMLRGHGEWRDVSDVVRSSFFVIAKELKRQDARLQALEAERRTQVEAVAREAVAAAEDGGRWEVLQKHVALLGDELKLLALQLSSSSARALEAAGRSDAAVQREQQRVGERHGAACESVDWCSCGC